MVFSHLLFVNKKKNSTIVNSTIVPSWPADEIIVHEYEWINLQNRQQKIVDFIKKCMLKYFCSWNWVFIEYFPNNGYGETSIGVNHIWCGFVFKTRYMISNRPFLNFQKSNFTVTILPSPLNDDKQYLPTLQQQ